nr:branched-chain amino acid ABC transporter permease [Homoserinimonas sp. OAct 916]
MLSSLAVAPAAHADEVGTDEYDYAISGFVKFQDEPLDGVLIKVEGNGYNAEVKTGADGKWKIGVPEAGTYTVTLVEDTLPEGVIVAEEGKDVAEVTFGQSKTKAMNFFLGQGERVTVSFFDQFLDRAFNGLSFGLLLALASIGLSLVFGTTGLVNFAHAEMLTFGAFMTFTFGPVLGFPIWLAIPIAVLLTGLFGFLNDYALWRPLRKRRVGIVQMMIVSIGLSITLRYLYQYIYGGQTEQLPGATGAEVITVGPISFTIVDVWSMSISIVLLFAVAFFLTRTRIGKATRAVSDNSALAAVSGINVERVTSIVWIISGLLAGTGGILWAYFRPGVNWDMGFQLLLLIFAAVILGGIGTAFGALVGSLIVGMFVELSTLWLPSDMKYVGALGILILVLLVRPQGILGRKERVG